jgi:hypothetical protein
MSGEASQPLHTWSAELTEWLAQLRSRTILFAMPALYILGVVLLVAVEALGQPFEQLWVSLGAFCLGLALLLLRRRYSLLAGWILTAGSLLLVLTIVVSWQVAPAIRWMEASVVATVGPAWG